MTAEEIRSAYQAHMALGPPATSDAAIAVAARGATVRCASGQEVIDLASGGFGYGHPHICARVAEQMRTLPLSSRVFFSRLLAQVVERLAEVTPGNLEVSYLCNSGAEAIEGALKLVKGYHRRRRRLVALKGSYHGSTLGALGVCGLGALSQSLPALPLETVHVSWEDSAAAQRAIDRQTAAVIVEPVLTGTGVKVPPAGFLKVLRQRCCATGTLLIADEIATGLGRTGARFGVDHDGVVPDVLVLGGILGGGVLPVSAYVTTQQINSRVYGRRDPALHGTTTGGNPAACVAALATLDVIEQENLTAWANEAGAELRQILANLCRRHGDNVLGWAGRGLLAAVRLRDWRTACMIQREALRRGVLVRLDGLDAGEAWIGLRPPLLINRAELIRALDGLEATFERVLQDRPHPVEMQP